MKLREAGYKNLWSDWELSATDDSRQKFLDVLPHTPGIYFLQVYTPVQTHY